MAVPNESPPADTLRDGLAELEDICVAAQELGERFREAGRPYLLFRTRELENECHDIFMVIELFQSRWEPVNDANP